MPIMYERVYNNRLLEKTVAYLATGIILIISHYFHSYAVVIYLGHLLIASSVLIAISLMLNYRWRFRICQPLDIYSGAVFIVTFTVGIIIFFIEELNYYIDNELLSQDLIESLFVAIVVVICVWLLLLCIPLIVPAFRPRTPVRIRQRSFVFIAVMVLFILNHFLKIFPLQNFLPVILIVAILVIVILRRHSLPKFKVALIHFSHLFAVLCLSFIIAGIISVFTKAIPAILFWISTIVSVIALIICILSLNKWRRIIFHLFSSILDKILSKLKSIFIEIKIFSNIVFSILYPKVLLIISAAINIFQPISRIIRTLISRLFLRNKKTSPRT